MNSDHSDGLILLAREFAGIDAQEATMTSVDRLGFHLRLKANEGMRGTRIAFLREVQQSSRDQKSSCGDDATGTAANCTCPNLSED
jgi:hypothetical protein